jgi:hypothetical protein
MARAQKNCEKAKKSALACFKRGRAVRIGSSLHSTNHKSSRLEMNEASSQAEHRRDANKGSTVLNKDDETPEDTLNTKKKNSHF